MYMSLVEPALNGEGMRFVRFRGDVFCLFLLLYLFILSASDIHAGTSDRTDPLKGKFEKLKGVLALDGRFIHNIGELQMNVTNWGFFGSLPKSNYDMADQPSAQWPAGSGIEYLYAAGIWIGAEIYGIPYVSTGYPETEFYPPSESRATIYRSFEGAKGGNRPPGPADDDKDGRIDEDWLNGYDDDGDGLIDEDFAAIGKQMFSCFYTDDQPTSTTIWPEHTPIHVQVRQESYQWGEEGLNTFIGVRYHVKNIGWDFLTNVYIGVYADVDAGPREYGNYHMDDQVGSWEGVWCAPKGDAEWPVRLHVAYAYDNDGDGGRTPGYFGIALLGYPIIYYGGVYYPSYSPIQMSTFRIFRGLQPYENGGEPTNDFQRYDVMSYSRKDPDTEQANDYKILVSVGPFFLPPYGSTSLDIAFVCGEGLDEMLTNAAIASIVYQGCFYDADDDPDTGVIGRESPVMGPLEMHYPDPCNNPTLIVDVPKKEICWTNLDCFEENWLWQYYGCYKDPYADKKYYMTGVDGKETRLNWITGTAPTPPNLRLVPGNRKVVLLWDDISETTPDPLTLDYDFEGYQIWRADNWHRPYGTTIDSGPGKELWHLLEMRDLINAVGPNVGFKKPFSQGGWEYEPLENLPNRDSYIRMFEESILYAPLDTVPCPPGLSNQECDTLEALARQRMGLEGGKRFYKYIDYEAKNGLPYFYSVIAYDHVIRNGVPYSQGRYNAPASNFRFVIPISDAQDVEGFDDKKVYVVPNPVTNENLAPWRMSPNNSDLTGIKLEFRNLPKCKNTVRIYTVAGDLVQVLYHDGQGGCGTLPWDLLTRNGQDITSGVYLFSVEPEDNRFSRTVGKFVVIR